MASPGGFALDVLPCRAHPSLHFLPAQHGEGPLQCRRGAVLSALAKKEDVLDIVLNDRARLVRFAIEASSVALRFRHSVGYLLPENGVKQSRPSRLPRTRVSA